MRKTRFFALLTAGIIAVSPVATIFSNQTTTTVLASKKPKKHIAAWKKRPIWYKTKGSYLNYNYRLPIQTVHINISKSNPLYSKVIEAIKAWNATGCCTFIPTKKKDANVRIYIDNSIHSNWFDHRIGETQEWAKYLHDVVLDQKGINEANDDPNVDEALIIVEHELGHALRLNHNKKNYKSVMAVGPDCPIQPCDVQNVKKLYHEK